MSIIVSVKINDGVRQCHLLPDELRLRLNNSSFLYSIAESGSDYSSAIPASAIVKFTNAEQFGLKFLHVCLESIAARTYERPLLGIVTPGLTA